MLESLNSLAKVPEKNQETGALHEHYDRLTPEERKFVDDAARDLMTLARVSNIKLYGNDEAERAVDALSRWILASKGATQ